MSMGAVIHDYELPFKTDEYMGKEKNSHLCSLSEEIEATLIGDVYMEVSKVEINLSTFIGIQ